MEAKGKQYILHPSRSDEFTVWNIADIHLGNKACAIDRVKEDIDIIKKDKRAFWFGGGDYAEYIGLDDKRFDPDCVHDAITIKDMGHLGKYLTQQIAELFGPIQHKCLGLLLGNHEKRYQQAAQQTHLHSWLCTELGVLNLEYSAFVDVVFVRTATVDKPVLSSSSPKDNNTTGNRRTYRFALHHGAGFAQTPGGKLNRLIDWMNMCDADIYMIGHVHDQQGRRHPTIGADAACRKLVEKVKIGVVSGSYLKTYAQGITTYGEQRMYKPTNLGAAFVHIQPDKNEVRGEI